MKTESVTYYKCEICGNRSTNKEYIEQCELQPITQDKGVKVGDTVRVTYGDGAGELATVTERFIVQTNWAPTSKYDHTVALCAKVKLGFHRTLVFDHYELV